MNQKGKLFEVNEIFIRLPKTRSKDLLAFYYVLTFIHLTDFVETLHYSTKILFNLLVVTNFSFQDFHVISSTSESSTMFLVFSDIEATISTYIFSVTFTKKNINIISIELRVAMDKYDLTILPIIILYNVSTLFCVNLQVLRSLQYNYNHKSKGDSFLVDF